LSYDSVSQLNRDPTFSGRVRSCVTEQADTLTGDANLAIAACANAGLRGDPIIMDTFVRTTSSASGLGDKAETMSTDATPVPIVDQSLILDSDILGAIQNNFPTVANLFFDTNGTRIA
jgi:hypothetical protein